MWSTFFARRLATFAPLSTTSLAKNTPLDFDDLGRFVRHAVHDTAPGHCYFKQMPPGCGSIPTGSSWPWKFAGGMTAHNGLQQRRGVIEPDSNSISRCSHAIEPANPAAVINFWGGTFHPLAEERGWVPIVSVHFFWRMSPYIIRAFPFMAAELIHPVADSLHIPKNRAQNLR